METLPVEILHRIFDNLDVETILFSIRSISRLFQLVVNNYNRLIFNGKLISKSNFSCLCRLIKAKNIISLLLSNGEGTSDQIDLFCSLVDFRQLIRLRSLTVLNITEDQLKFIFNRFDLKLLNSFSFRIAWYTYRHMDTIINSLFSTFAHSNLHQLEIDLLIYGGMSKLTWPNHCSIEILTINSSINIENILTIEDVGISIDKLESLLLRTPSLIYFKLIGGQNMLDGKRWEQFIQTNLFQLNKFEFFFSNWLKYNKISDNPQRILASFRTPFWIKYKKWFVTCECDIFNFTTIRIYSIPLCKSWELYQPRFQNFSISTRKITTENESTLMNNVKSLSLTLNEDIVDDINKKNTMMNYPLFPKVSTINIMITSDWIFSSLESLSRYINIAQIIQMKLKPYYSYDKNKDKWIDFTNFLQQTHHLLLLSIEGSSSISESYHRIEHIYSICPRQLKHLEIPITAIDQMKIILERCQNLSTIILHDRSKYSKCSKEIIEWFQNNTINSTCKHDSRTITVWIGKKRIQSNCDDRTNHKRIKLIDNSSNYRN